MTHLTTRGGVLRRGTSETITWSISYTAPPLKLPRSVGVTMSGTVVYQYAFTFSFAESMCYIPENVSRDNICNATLELQASGHLMTDNCFNAVNIFVPRVASLCSGMFLNLLGFRCSFSSSEFIEFASINYQRYNFIFSFSIAPVSIKFFPRSTMIFEFQTITGVQI